jgi:hypothetical protein
MEVETIHPTTVPVEARVRVYKGREFTDPIYEHYLREETVLTPDSWGMFLHTAIKTADYTLGMEEWDGIEITRVRWNGDKQAYELVEDARVIRIGRVQ